MSMKGIGWGFGRVSNAGLDFGIGYTQYTVFG